MTISGLHHFNIRVDAAELESLKTFYRDVIGLTLGPRPPFASTGVWLYAQQAAVLHITQMNSGEIAAPGSAQTLPDVQHRHSAIDHVAFASRNPDHAVNRLKKHGVAYSLAKVPSAGEIQIFCRDPSGNGVELIFPMSEGAAA